MKNALVDHHRAKGSFPPNPEAIHANARGQYVAAIVFTPPVAGDKATLDMLATFNTTQANPRIAGKTLHYHTRDGGATWQCSAGSEPTALPANLLPSACK
ncbi:MAG: pilin [Magnetococcus sp. YQC-9]